ncbi:MAG TPA: MOSC domain-containing protein [Lachnospiraceae bacterium]|nr:MOSC domain-containing protein [Lachnospiraceae bacterium]
MGRILAVNISEKKGVPKEPIEFGILVENHGVQGDAHAGNWHRQVSLLGMESIRKIDLEVEKGLCVGKFAENLTTEGIELYTLPIGTKLQVGEEVVMEVTQIGKECHEGCAIRELVGDCVMPREGIFTKILKGGKVKAGDEINEVARS